jgi:hypothetical protein
MDIAPDQQEPDRQEKDRLAEIDRQAIHPRPTVRRRDSPKIGPGACVSQALQDLLLAGCIGQKLIGFRTRPDHKKIWPRNS